VIAWRAGLTGIESVRQAAGRRTGSRRTRQQDFPRPVVRVRAAVRMRPLVPGPAGRSGKIRASGSAGAPWHPLLSPKPWSSQPARLPNPWSWARPPHGG